MLVVRTVDQILANLPLFASLAVLASLSSVILKILNSPSARKIPKIGGGSFLIGNAAEYGKDPVTYIRDATVKYGKLFQMKLLSTNVIWLRGVKLNKAYLETREDTWSFGDGMGTFLNKVVLPGYFSNLRTLVSSLNRGINRSAALEHYTRIALTESRDTVTKDWTSQPSLELFHNVSVLVHKILVKCLMGPDFYDHHGPELYDLLHRMETDIGHIFNMVLPEWVPHPPARRLRKARDRVSQIVIEMMEKRKENPDAWSDGLDYMAFLEKDKATAHLKHMYPAHQTLLMFASHTSTVASVSWTILKLLQNPEYLTLVRDDLEKIDAFKASPHLSAALKETGRHYSGVNMLRIARKPHTIPGTDAVAPQGSIISISPYLTHHDPSIYEKADEWYPHRWLADLDMAKKKLNVDGIAYMPFGAGSHRCPGEKLAVIIAECIVGTVVKECEVGWGNKGGLTSDPKLDFSKVGSPWALGDVEVKLTKKERRFRLTRTGFGVDTGRKSSTERS